MNEAPILPLQSKSGGSGGNVCIIGSKVGKSVLSVDPVTYASFELLIVIAYALSSSSPPMYVEYKIAEPVEFILVQKAS